MNIQSGFTELLEMLVFKSQRYIEEDRFEGMTEFEKGCVLMEAASHFLLCTIRTCVAEEGYEEVLAHFYTMAKMQLVAGSEEKEVKNELH